MIRSILRRGVLYTFGIIFNRIIPAGLFRFRVFRVYELAGMEDIESDQRFHFDWCESEADLREAREATFFDSPDPKLMDRTEVCVAREQGKLVGGVWRAEQWFDEDELGMRIDLSENQAWIFAAYVAKTHRGQGVYSQLLNSVLLNRNGEQHFASINPTNKPSVAAHRKFTRSTVGTCVVVRVFRVAACWTSGSLRSSRRLSFNCSRTPLRLEFSSDDSTHG